MNTTTNMSTNTKLCLLWYLYPSKNVAINHVSGILTQNIVIWTQISTLFQGIFFLFVGKQEATVTEEREPLTVCMIYTNEPKLDVHK